MVNQPDGVDFLWMITSLTQAFRNIQVDAYALFGHLLQQPCAKRQQQ
jgi:hypothetical protein